MSLESASTDGEKQGRLRLRTGVADGAVTGEACDPSGAAATTAAVDETADSESKTAHHQTGVLIVILILLLFAAGGFALYKVLTYPADPTSANEAAGGQSAATGSAPVPVDREAVRSKAEEPTTVIVGTSEVPVLTVFESTLQMPALDRQAIGQAEASNALETSAAKPLDKDRSDAIGGFIAGLYIGSVRLGETDPRVILDERSYSRGERIHGPYEIRFIAAIEGMLYFEDEKGIVYRRRF